MAYELAIAKQYDSYYTYSGPAGEVLFEALGPAGREMDLKGAVEGWAEIQGLSMIQLQVETDEVLLWTNKYRVYILWHGSPFLWAAVAIPLIWAVSIIVSGFFAWRALEVYFGVQRTYYEVTKNEQQILAGMTPSERDNYVKARQQTTVAPPSTPGLELGDMVKWGVVGAFGIVGLLTIKEFLPRR